MQEKIKKYIKVLRIELEDLEEDLLVMAEIYHQRERKDEITDYVFLENVSLLQSEIAGIEKLLGTLDEIDPSRFGHIDEFVESLDTAFRRKTEDAGYPDSVYELVKRKLKKVSKYIMSAED